MAWYGDQELPVGQPRQQAVLGILAMRANRVISRGELVDAVWGQDPPVSAEGGIYTYVAGLRRIIEPNRSLRGPGRVLVSSGAGYVLHLVPGQPDAVAFEQDLGRARQLRKAGDPAGAVTALNSALALWRGIAFAGVPGRPAGARRRTRHRPGRRTVPHIPAGPDAGSGPIGTERAGYPRREHLGAARRRRDRHRDRPRRRP